MDEKKKQFATAYRGLVDSVNGHVVRGWCCVESGENCDVHILINGVLCLKLPAIKERDDLKKLEICHSGGGFEIDISSFLKNGKNSVLLTAPNGSQLVNGRFDIESGLFSAGEKDWVGSVRAKICQNKAIGVYGDLEFASNPNKGSVFSKIIQVLGLSVVKNDSAKAVHSIWFGAPHMPRLNAPENCINYNFKDNTKSFIDKAHLSVFGRSVCVTDFDQDEKYVVKSEANAAHDGVTVLGAELKGLDLAGKTVQRIINNRSSEDMVCDIRVPVVGKTIPLVYLKYRPLSNRFSNTNATSVISMTNTVLSGEEQEQILKFCSLINLEYGELDVLRDQDTGEIWIVDANNTPAGPPNGLPAAERQLAAREISIAFDRNFLGGQEHLLP